jgi:hypothetical protein
VIVVRGRLFDPSPSSDPSDKYNPAKREAHIYSLIHVRRALSLTFGFRRLVVRLTNKFLILHQVELIAGVELPRAEGARKTLQVIHVVLGASNDLSGRNS